jgi:hypothetical protein
MKYLITQSQIDKIVFKYLDNQDFIQFERNDSIYFVNSEGERYPQIRYDKDDNWCVIYYGLVKEISTFFSIKGSDSESLIGRWVEHTLQMKVTKTFKTSYGLYGIVENA